MFILANMLPYATFGNKENKKKKREAELKTAKRMTVDEVGVNPSNKDVSERFLRNRKNLRDADPLEARTKVFGTKGKILAPYQLADDNIQLPRKTKYTDNSNTAGMQLKSEKGNKIINDSKISTGKYIPQSASTIGEKKNKLDPKDILTPKSPSKDIKVQSVSKAQTKLAKKFTKVPDIKLDIPQVKFDTSKVKTVTEAVKPKGKGGIGLGLALGAGVLGIAGVGTALALANRKKKENKN